MIISNRSHFQKYNFFQDIVSNKNRVVFEIHQNSIGRKGEGGQWALVRCKCCVCRECLESESLLTLVSIPRRRVCTIAVQSGKLEEKHDEELVGKRRGGKKKALS